LEDIAAQYHLLYDKKCATYFVDEYANGAFLAHYAQKYGAMGLLTMGYSSEETV
jgi:hypothetical protein